MDSGSAQEKSTSRGYARAQLERIREVKDGLGLELTKTEIDALWFGSTMPSLVSFMVLDPSYHHMKQRKSSLNMNEISCLKQINYNRLK